MYIYIYSICSKLHDEGVGVALGPSRMLPGGGHVVLWSARPRAFDKEADRLWVANAAAKLGLLLNAEAEPLAVSELCLGTQARRRR